MKIIRDVAPTGARPPEPQHPADDPESQSSASDTARYPWKVLVVDDEPDVRNLTRLTLRNMTFAGRPMEFLEAGSCAEAMHVLRAHDDIAVALIDVVMETEDAGLKLVESIRRELKNHMIRLVIRTGQPGTAPERYVIDHYDIDDYKDKTELTATRLYTTIRSTLKAYRDLTAVDLNRRGLERVLEAAPAIYQIGATSLADFFSGVLTQIIGLCRLTHASHIGSVEGLIATIDQGQPKVHASTTNFSADPRFRAIHDECVRAVLLNKTSILLRQDAEILPLHVENKPVGYIYIEPVEQLTDDDQRLIRIMARQCSQALENFELHTDIVKAFENTIDMLAEIAEFKDKATGDHINRLDAYTRAISLAMGLSAEEALRNGKASRLHDVGKIGIPDHILGKPDKLSTDEFDVIKNHTRLGAAILGHDESFSLAREIALRHHERWDGNGYPDKLPSSNLPLVTRIVSVSDVFDALISQRPYKAAWSVAEARRMIAAGAGTQFDPAVVEAFLRVLDSGQLAASIEEAVRHTATA